MFQVFLSFRISFVRKKKTIRFCFVLQDLSQWKTEPLYKYMLAHPRFDPILCVTPNIYGSGAEKEVETYCKDKGYEYVLLSPNETIGRKVGADMVTHQKPYQSEIHLMHRIEKNIGIPVVSIPYFLSTITENWVVNQKINLLSWRQFIDNQSCADEWKRIHYLGGANYAVTGTPIMDVLSLPKERFEDVWKCKDGRKRIIYAPHHTIGDYHWAGIGYSTFLDVGEFVLKMRDKYQDQVYFVFKPHPLLYGKLIERWGKEKTDAYYHAWDCNGVSNIEAGEYMGLFKYSDALIHDCGSFTVEYLYTGNPVMYLLRDEHHADNMIPYAKMAFDLHYKGKTEKDIERFIQNIIAGVDEMKKRRVEFREKCLLPPNNRTACENIVDEILGNNKGHR